MGDVYDQFADAFAEADRLPTWLYAGKPAMQDLFGGLLSATSRYLDLGSASGRVEAGILLPQGVNARNITGVEISPKEVAIARERIPGATFVVGDIADPSLLSHEDGAYDVVFSHMVFEHLDDEQLLQTCANANRLLKGGGTLLFVVTHPEKMTDLEGNLLTTYGRFETTAPWGGVLHNWRRSVGDTRLIVENAGFTIDVCEDVRFPAEAPDGLSAEDRAAFAEAAAKYRRYPAIRLSVKATKI